MSTKPVCPVALLLCLAFTSTRALAQNTPATSRAASTPEALARLVMQTFSTGTPDEFAAIFPDSSGRVFMREARGTRISQLADVVRKSPRRAVLLLGGITRPGNSTGRGAAAGGNETNGARHFSGFYEAVRSNGAWHLTHQIPFDSANFIRSHTLQVDVDPIKGLHVVDTMGIAVGAPHGFAVRLNNAAQIRDVRLNGRPVKRLFGGGVLWVDAPAKQRSQLVLTYDLEPSRNPADSAATGVPAFGAYHNTDVWHPFFHYLSANDFAAIDATVRIPSQYYLTTTIPQTDSVRDGIRTIHARGNHGVFLLALVYDREWQPHTTDFGSFRFESFATPAFRHSSDSLAVLTKRVYDLLATRFGEPQSPSRYLAAVQNRTLGAGGFNVRMNNAAMSGAGGGAAVLESPSNQVFLHETAHAWTLNSTGLAANFLHEGWATFAEALALRAWFTAADERSFWERQRAAYIVGADRAGFRGGFEGKQSILGNYDNGRIHYRKGVWIFRLGNYVMGDSAFNRGMRLFMAGLGKGPSGYEQLIAAWSKAAGRNMEPLVMPWLRGKYIPDVDARVEGTRLIVMQQQPDEVFVLPKLTIELLTSAGPVRRVVDLEQRADTLDVASGVTVKDVRVDPDHEYLLQRHWGEPEVRFELPAAKVPEGATAALYGNFLRAPIPAQRVGDMWVVQLPMTEGEYVWLWQINRPGAPAATDMPADSTLTGTRIVRPLQRISNAYPGR